MALMKLLSNSDTVKEAAEDGFVLVTGGESFISLNVLENEYVGDVEEASNKAKTLVRHVEACESPKLAKALGCVAVPSVFHVVDGEVIGSFVGVASVEQLVAYFQTGVSPV